MITSSAISTEGETPVVALAFYEVDGRVWASQLDDKGHEKRHMIHDKREEAGRC